jgi:thiol-disulfide isomerase/thioredoxin
MVTKQSAISQERFASAATYQQYRGQIEKNTEEFDDNYANTKVSPEYAQRLKAVVAKPNGPKKLIVLGEDWCPDVYRGLPVLQRIAEAAGIDLRVLPRDQNLDVADMYLNKGEFRSVPTAVFLTDNLDQIGVFYERPARATAELPQMSAVVGDRPREEAAEDLKAFRRGPIWGGWRQYTIEDITTMLEQATA